ncbi:MAG: leucine-rich repeat protein [Clostridia bacterium]|nr:leucine-rich repeat protein [Clostridia bacterium]
MYGKRFPDLKASPTAKIPEGLLDRFSVTIHVSYPFDHTRANASYYNDDLKRYIPFAHYTPKFVKGFSVPLYDQQLIEDIKFNYEGVDYDYLTENVVIPDYFSDLKGSITVEDGVWTWRADSTTTHSGTLNDGTTYEYLLRPVVRAYIIEDKCYTLLAYYECDVTEYDPKYKTEIEICEAPPQVEINATPLPKLYIDSISDEKESVYTKKKIKIKEDLSDLIGELQDGFYADLDVSAKYKVEEAKYAVNGSFETSFAITTVGEAGKPELTLPIFDIDSTDKLGFIFDGAEYIDPYALIPSYWSEVEFEKTEDGLRAIKGEAVDKGEYAYTAFPAIKILNAGERCYVTFPYYEYRFSKYPEYYEKAVKAIEEGLDVVVLYKDVPLATAESDFAYIVDANGATITEYKGNAENVIIPEVLGGYPVTAIGKDAFREWGDWLVKTVVLPKTLKRIEDRAFYYCKKMDSIVLPEGLEYIGEYAFALCGFNEIRIPDSVTLIGKRAFEYQLNEYFKEKPCLVYLGSGFCDTQTVRNADLGSADLYLHDGTKVPALTYDTADARTIESVSAKFGYGPNETEYVFTDIPEAARVQCNFTRAVKAVFPSTLKYLAEANITGYPDVVLSAETEIAYAALAACEIDTLSFTGTGRTLNEGAFKDLCAHTVILPEGITVIPERAFMDASIDRLVLPSTVKKIEKYAFLGFKGEIDVADNARIESISSLAYHYGKMSAKMQNAISGARLTDRDHDERIYLGDDGYYHIKDSNIKLPADGVYINYSTDRSFSFFASEEAVLTPRKEALRSAGFSTDGKRLWLSYGDGSDPIEIKSDEPLEYNSSAVTLDLGTTEILDVKTVMLSDGLAHGIITFKDGREYECSIVVKDRGASVKLLPTNLQFFDENYGYYDTDVLYAAGMRIVWLYITDDGGDTFHCMQEVNHCDKNPYTNEVIAINVPLAMDSEHYYGQFFDPVEGFTYLTCISPTFFLSKYVKSASALHYFSLEKPYIEGETGVARLRCEYPSENGKIVYYAYIISFDGGQSWELFDPRREAYLEKVEVEIAEYRSIREYEGHTFTVYSDHVQVPESENVLISTLGWKYNYAGTPSRTITLFNKAIKFRDGSNVPAYCGVFTSANRIYTEWNYGKPTYFISYNDYEKTVIAPSSFTDGNGNTVEMNVEFNSANSAASNVTLNYYISKPLTWYWSGRVLVISTDAGSSFRYYIFNDEIDNITWLTQTEIYAVCRKTADDGSYVYSAFRSRDSGMTFTEEAEVTRAGSFGMVINGVEYRVSTVKVKGEFAETDQQKAEILIDGKPAEGYLPPDAIHGEFNAEVYPAMPYFDGDFGVWAMGVNGLELVYLTFDGGRSWINYSASPMALLWGGSPYLTTGK